MASLFTHLHSIIYLLVVLFISPLLAFTNLSLSNSSIPEPNPTSDNDAFRAIVLGTPAKPSPPICCLKPLPNQDTPQEDLLLSFEDWKAKQITQKAAGSNKSAQGAPPSSASSSGTGNGEDSDAGATQANAVGDDTGATGGGVEGVKAEALSPHFRVPLTDRFNYASLDCSARVHSSHKAAKSASAILSSKKDKYMLSPCTKNSNEQHYVVVELCEDIRIDTVQLANFEFFSGVFKEFTVSVAKTDTTDKDGWTFAGRYKGKNIRGVQSFHPPTSLRDFYRYIRIDFHSHYGNEFYCPISLLRVYGLTHLEQWKWDMWEEEYRAKHPEIAVAAAAEAELPIPAPVQLEATTVAAAIAVDSAADASVPSVPSPATAVDIPSTPPPEAQATPPPVPPKDKDAQQSAGIADERAAPSEDLTETMDLTSMITFPTHTPTGTELLDHNYSAPIIDGSSSQQQSQASSVLSSSSSATVTITASPPPPPSSSSLQPFVGGGESIYKVIMNRLTALEHNTTLYARYAEEQSAGMREVLRRLGEDVGRLEGIGKAQTQVIQRTLTEWENQRRRLDSEFSELLSRVDYLADEIVLEKRLGMAQLCILLTVLVFMALTRGSASPVMHQTQYSGALKRRSESVKEWGRRHLKLNLSRDSWNLTGRARTDSQGTESTDIHERSASQNEEQRSPDDEETKGRVINLADDDDSLVESRQFKFPRTPSQRQSLTLQAPALEASTSTSTNASTVTLTADASTSPFNTTSRSGPSLTSTPTKRKPTRLNLGSITNHVRPRTPSSTLRSQQRALGLLNKRVDRSTSPTRRVGSNTLLVPLSTPSLLDPPHPQSRPPMRRMHSSGSSRRPHSASGVPGPAALWPPAAAPRANDMVMMTRTANLSSAAIVPPRSAKKWAKSAHLHYGVKTPRSVQVRKERERDRQQQLGSGPSTELWGGGGKMPMLDFGESTSEKPQGDEGAGDIQVGYGMRSRSDTVDSVGSAGSDLWVDTDTNGSAEGSDCEGLGEFF